MTLKSDAKFEEKLICCFRNDKKLVNFNPSTRKSRKNALGSSVIDSFCAKYVMFELKSTKDLPFTTLKNDT